MSEAVIVENVTKHFRRYDEHRPASLKEAVLRGFKGIGHRQKFCALRDISFRVARGQAVGVIGQNGAGKSTLLRLIGGVGRPNSGRIQVNGRVGALLDLTTGFHPDLTGLENIFVSGVICGLTRREVAQKLDSIVAFSEVEKFINNPVRTYSTGMQMRLGFAVAIHTDPEVLLIDEVLAVGDLSFQQKCLARIKRLRDKGCTILLITHDLGQVQEFCDEVLWLQQGQIAARGNPEIIVGEYKARLSSETRRRTPLNASSVLTPMGTELRVNRNRFGSMEAQITRVTLVDDEGSSTHEINAGEGLSVAIEFQASKPLVAPIFTVTISRPDGFVCVDSSTEAQNVQLGEVEGANRITLHLKRLDLAGGDYFVDVGVFEKNWVYGYDYHWHVYPLRISARNSKGIVQPPQLWELSGSSANRSVQDAG